MLPLSLALWFFSKHPLFGRLVARLVYRFSVPGIVGVDFEAIGILPCPLSALTQSRLIVFWTLDWPSLKTGECVTALHRLNDARWFGFQCICTAGLVGAECRYAVWRLAWAWCVCLAYEKVSSERHGKVAPPNVQLTTVHPPPSPPPSPSSLSANTHHDTPTSFAAERLDST